MAQQVYNVGDEPVPGSGYRLVEFIGRGGFGEVWKATGPGGIEVALKVIRLGGIEGRKEFRALQLCKRIRHPNVVPILAFWLKSADGSVLDDSLIDQQEELRATAAASSSLQETMVVPPGTYAPKAAELVIAMGLGDRSLTDRLRECQDEGLEGIPAEELLEYIEDAAEAIDYLSNPERQPGTVRASIQHCDIKPQNILIVGGATQVCDFGLARDMATDKTTTAAASLAYAAPEYLEKGNPSHSTDQYSLAVAYYELRTGTLPYESETHVAVVHAKLQGALEFSRVSPPEQEVLRRATAQNPDERFPSATAMVKALRGALAGEPVEAYQPAVTERAERPAGGPLPMLKVLVFLPILVAVGVGGWLLWDNYGDKVVALFSGGDQNGPNGENGPKKTNGKRDGDKRKGTGNGPSTQEVTIDQAEAAEAGARSETDFNGAADKYSKVINTEPRREVMHRAYLGRARCREKVQQYAQAVADYEAATELDDSSTEARLGQARCHVEMGRSDLAIAPLDEIIDVDATNGEALILRAQCYMDQENWSAAIEDFQSARRIDDERYGRHPEFAEAYVMRGLDKLGEDRETADSHDMQTYDAIIDDFQEAVRLDPENRLGLHKPEPFANAFVGRARQHLIEGQYQAAVADCDQAQQYNPDDVRIYSRRGSAYFRQGDTEEEILRFTQKAVEEFTKAIDLDSKQTREDIIDLLNRGRARLRLARYDEAGDDFTAAIEQDTRQEYASPYYFRAECRFEQSDFQAAVDDYSKAIEICKQNPDTDFQLSDAYIGRALSYRALADMSDEAARPRYVERAIDDLSETLRLDPNSRAELHAARAEWYRQVNRPEAAAYDQEIIGLYQRLETSPNDKQSRRQLADLLATCPEPQIRNGKLAVELATEAAKGEGAEQPEYLATLAAAHAEAGDTQQAVSLAEKALAAAKDDSIKAQIETQLAQYRQGKPWHRPK